MEGSRSLGWRGGDGGGGLAHRHTYRFIDMYTLLLKISYLNFVHLGEPEGNKSNQ